MPAQTINKSSVYLYWLPVLGCMGLIFCASSIPGSDIPPIFAYQDIAYHFFIYLILSILCLRALKKTCLGIKMLEAVLFTTIFGILYGVTDEWHQGFISYRSVSGFDVFVDSIGSIAGSLVYRWLK